MICRCCGNDVKPTSGITMYWLIGRNHIWSVCYRCWNKPFLKALFLNSKQDLPNELIKKFGLSLGYTKKEMEVKNDN